MIRISGPESESGVYGEQKTLSDAFVKLFNKDAKLTQTLPATTKQQEVNVYVDESTGAFRLGEIFHQDPQMYVNFTT